MEVIINPLPICSITGGLVLCEGASSELCATGTGSFLWSTGATTSCITVNTAGIYSVTITSPDGCSSTCQVEVIITDTPVCVINGGLTFCEGGSTELCVPAGAQSYLWSNGETTNCIIVNEPGLYSVVVTYEGGCSSSCEAIVIENPLPICSITGGLVLCEGGSTELCATGTGSFLWSTGATTSCITVNTAGIYSVTITSPDGCESTCQVTVIINPLPICSITGGTTICEGTITQICVPDGQGSYLWNTGATTSCITVSEGGLYSVTITSLDGCTSTCEQPVTVTPAPVCTITGGTLFCEGGSTELCVPAGAVSYLWSNGGTLNCTTVTTPGVYSVVVTYDGGCESTCSITVTTTPPPVCTIIGSTSFCEGEPSKLCGPEDAYSYLWSTGETTECIDVTVAGTYT
ncbi:MAG: hypothetical protein IPM46_12845 [Flavobacteriales bacterium]|nr:hypothetical protein [Flavobacteriales bacterium]